jgi:hypothetical protein
MSMRLFCEARDACPRRRRIKRQIHDARLAGAPAAPGCPQDIIAKAKRIAASAAGRTEVHEGALEPADEFDVVVVDRLRDRHGDDAPDEIVDAVKAGHRIIAGQTTLSEQIEAYLAEIKGHVR